MAVSDKAKELKSQGIQIVSMGSGEPDFDTPANIQKAAVKAIGAGETRYTPADGTPGLKKAICEKFKRENGLDYSATEVMVSCGGKQVFYNLCQAILNEGDEVLVKCLEKGRDGKIRLSRKEALDQDIENFRE